jgi:hypothetical protein
MNESAAAAAVVMAAVGPGWPHPTAERCAGVSSAAGHTALHHRRRKSRPGRYLLLHLLLLLQQLLQMLSLVCSQSWC